MPISIRIASKFTGLIPKTMYNITSLILYPFRLEGSMTSDLYIYIHRERDRQRESRYIVYNYEEKDSSTNGTSSWVVSNHHIRS